MPYYGDTLPYYYGGPFSNHSSLMTGTGRTLHSPLGSTRYAPHLTTISESPLSTLRRYSPAAVAITTRPKRIIDTADIDVSTPRALTSTRNNEQRNRLRRDRPTIRIRSQALKDNPALREHYERHEKTVGELLVEKFLIKEKKAGAEQTELRTKLYSPINLEDNLTKKERDDLQEAIKRRITRRMTRRRLSTDVQMDTEQLEREVLFAQAQADALDTLVAEEQAEFEVEARMGTLVRKNLVRSVPPIARSGHEAVSGDDGEDSRTKKLPKKVKKRRKTSDKPSPPSESDFDSEQDAVRTKKMPKERNEESRDNNGGSVDEAAMILGHNEAPEYPEGRTNEDDHREESSVSLSTGGLKFKVEASNSVGDFSTLWVNASIPEEQECQRDVSRGAIEQFRDSVRLPAPKLSLEKIAKSKKDAIVEEHQQIVVIPVRKRYLKDEARNSVYLTLKTQKNSNKIAEVADKIDRFDAIDKSPPSAASSTTINGKTKNEERPRDNSILDDNTTPAIERQPRFDKVAKFRSKDITESDVEVKSISDLTAGPAGVRRGKTGTKDASLQNSSEADTCEMVAKESTSVTSNRDENVSAPKPFAEDRSNDRTDAKVSEFFNDSRIDHEIRKTRDTDDNIGIAKNSIAREIEGFDTRNEEISVEDVATEKFSNNLAAGKTVKAPVRRAKKSAKLSQEKNNLVNDETKRIKRSRASSLDRSSTGVTAENSQERKNEEKEQLGVEETVPSAARLSSSVTPRSDLVESLPNASTIHFTVIAHDSRVAPGIRAEVSNLKGIENEDIAENENLSSPRNIACKIGDSRNETLKPIGVDEVECTGVKDLDESRKVKEEIRNLVQQSATSESSRILTPTKNDANLAAHENDESLTAEASEKEITSANATRVGDDKDAVELPKLRKNRKVISSRNNSAEIVVSSSAGSPGLQVVSEATKNVRTIAKNGSVLPCSDDEIYSARNESILMDKIKDAVEIASMTIKSEDTTAKARIHETTKLPKVLTNANSKTIVETKKDEEIDFWGEIENETNSFVKRDDRNSDVTRRDKAVDSMMLVLEAETKSKTPSESGTRERTEKPVADEKKSNKVKKKKKKTSENGGCEKKVGEEKASAETIFERLKFSDDPVDEEKRQCAERLEQRCEKLDETSITGVLGGEKALVIREIDKFNLSTIVEESPSPNSDKIPKGAEPFDLVDSSLKKTKEKASSELAKDSSSFPVNSASTVNTSGEDVATSATLSLDKPDLPITKVYSVSDQSSNDTVSPSSKIGVPSINIIVSPSTPPDEEIQPEVKVDEEIPEAEEGPGTPTNETVNEKSNSIAKWQALDDLSLDQPDKDIGPEVARAAAALKETSKKKVGNTKSTSKKSTGSGKSNSSEQDSSKKKKQLGKKKKTSTKSSKGDTEKKTDEKSGSKASNSSDATLKPGGQNILYSPKNSGCNSPKQRPLDLIKMFYTTPASLLTATPRDLSKVRRAKIKKRKHSGRTASASSDSTRSTRSTQSTGTAESTASTEHEDDAGQKRISSTRSNDSGFDGSPRLSNCDMACHKKCEKLTGNLCGLNQKLVAEALQALKRAPSQSSDNQRNSDGSDHHASGRVTPPATNLPRFKKYNVADFNFLKVLGKGSFGKVLLAELRRTDCVYAVKCLKKDVVLEDDDVECTLIERKVLTLATRHPYLCHLFCTFQTDSHLFFVMEYLNGGDLMFHIQKSGRFAESRARFYAAEIWSGLNFLHKKGIVYRDLKLDNVLLDFEGHIRIADFGMCKLQIFLDRTADTFCGTPDYMAPEIIKGLKYNQSVDWWSFGVLLYEMLTGQSPFSGCDEDELFWSICNERPFIPRYLSQEAMDILICLLEKDAGKRPPAHEISVHPFFHSLQWERLERRQLEPPFKPALEHTLDTRYFDTAFTAERPRLTPVPEQILTSMDQGVFRGFSYTNPNATD